MFQVQMKLHTPLGAEKVSALLGALKHFRTGGVPAPRFHYSEPDRYGFVRHWLTFAGCQTNAAFGYAP